MSVDVTVRHMKKGGSIQTYAKSKAEGIVESFPRVEYVHVVLDTEKHLFMAEVIVQAKNHIRVEASESSDQLRASIDKAFDRVEKQLRKLRNKVQDKKRHTVSKGKAEEIIEEGM